MNRKLLRTSTCLLLLFIPAISPVASQCAEPEFYPGVASKLGPDDVLISLNTLNGKPIEWEKLCNVRQPLPLKTLTQADVIFDSNTIPADSGDNPAPVETRGGRAYRTINEGEVRYEFEASLPEMRLPPMTFLLEERPSFMLEPRAMMCVRTVSSDMRSAWTGSFISSGQDCVATEIAEKQGSFVLLNVTPGELKVSDYEIESTELPPGVKSWINRKKYRSVVSGFDYVVVETTDPGRNTMMLLDHKNQNRLIASFATGKEDAPAVYGPGRHAPEVAQGIQRKAFHFRTLNVFLKIQETPPPLRSVNWKAYCRDSAPPALRTLSLDNVKKDAEEYEKLTDDGASICSHTLKKRGANLKYSESAAVYSYLYFPRMPKQLYDLPAMFTDGVRNTRVAFRHLECSRNFRKPMGEGKGFADEGYGAGFVAEVMEEAATGPLGAIVFRADPMGWSATPLEKLNKEESFENFCSRMHCGHDALERSKDLVDDLADYSASELKAPDGRKYMIINQDGWFLTIHDRGRDDKTVCGAAPYQETRHAAVID